MTVPGSFKQTLVILLASMMVMAGGAFSDAEAQRYSHGHKGGGNHSGGGRHDGGHRGGSGNAAGAIMLGVGVLSAIQDARRSRAEPERTYRKPVKKKTTVRRPKANPPKKTIARRTPPRPGPSVSAPAILPEFRSNEILVLFDDSQPDGVADEVASRHGLTRLESLKIALVGGRVQKYSINDGRTVQQVASAVAADSAAGPVQFNYLYRLNGSAAKNPSSEQYSLAKLSVGPAHEIAQGANIRIAVIDTGVDRSHPSLRGSVSEMFDAVNDGKVAIHPHGTAIAGLIAGHGKVQGVAPKAQVLAVRAFYLNADNGTPETSSFILLRAFDWAVEHNAKIFNMSFAGPADPLVRKALEAAREKGVVHVAAAGNGGAKAPPAYPAAYSHVIAITALDHKDRLYKDANQGGYLTVAAPGVDVLVPSTMKRYSYSSGTSLAAAHVSGLVALLLERKPDAEADAIADVISASAHDLGPAGHDVQFGAGRADALASLTLLADREQPVVQTSQR